MTAEPPRSVGRRGQPNLPDRARPTVFVIAQHQLIAEGLAFALQLEGFKVQAVVPPLTEELTVGGSLNPGLALIDVDSMDVDDPFRLVVRLACLVPVVVLMRAVDPLAQADWIEAGATGLVDKEGAFGDLLEVLHRVVSGEVLIPADERERLLELGHKHTTELRSRRELFLTLTAREQGVLVKLLEGKAATAIARDSVVSVLTVRSQIRSVLRKLGVHSQLEAVALARQSGWTPEASTARRSPRARGE